MQCTNNMKQWGLAMANYESSHQKYPFGAITGLGGLTKGGSSRRQTFVPSLWPYFEQGSLADSYDFNYSFWDTKNRPVTAYQVPMYYCPSDRQGLWMADQFGPRARGNYVVSWGLLRFHANATRQFQTRRVWMESADGRG